MLLGQVNIACNSEVSFSGYPTLVGTFSPSIFMYKLNPVQKFLFNLCKWALNPVQKFLFNLCKWALKPSISVLHGSTFSAGYREHEMLGEACPEMLPCPSMVLTRYFSLLAYATAGAERYKPNHQEYI